MIPDARDCFGEVRGKAFVVHKLPEHVVRVYNAFGCGETRLKSFFSKGILTAIIFFYPNANQTICYRVNIEKWLNGLPWKNRLPDGHIEIQRLIGIDECEKN